MHKILNKKLKHTETSKIPQTMKESVINIELKSERKQKIIVGVNLVGQIEKLIKKRNYNKVIIFVDLRLKKLHSPYLRQLIKAVNPSDVIYITTAPHIKDFSFLKKIIGKLIDSRINRGSTVIAFGGGTLIDLIGFVASLYMRGVDLVAIPTTFMAQCDTVIGKVGINYKRFKHLLGSFYSPALTFCDSYFLKSLDNQEVINGLVEVWKHALLTRDKNLLNYFSNPNFSKFGGNTRVLQEIIESSVLIKKSFVEKDFLDLNGYHAALSLGHTFANYLERDGNIRHGEAILVGIIFCTFLSKRGGLLNDSEMNSILKSASIFLKALRYNKSILKKIKSADTILEGLKFDKMNNEEGNYNFVVQTNNGYALLRRVRKDLIIECLELLNNFLRDNYLR